jgi:hypothetical protein
MTDIITTQDRASQALSRIGQLAESLWRSEGADFLPAVRADYDVVADALATLAELRGKLEGTEACYRRAQAEADMRRGKLEGTEACYQRAKAEAVVRCDLAAPQILPGAEHLLCEKPVGHLWAHHCGETSWMPAAATEPTTAEIRAQAAAMWGTGWDNSYISDGDVAQRFAWARAALIGGATT